MIRIIKPAEAPDVLTKKGIKKAAALKGNYTKYQHQYESGARAFSFDKKIYADESVKQALIEAQHGKCCFCESKITHISYGNVEHFRPKAGHRQAAEDNLTRPGYYWLAYCWDNLFLCCQLCNQRFKRNVFPLADPGLRALSHHHNLALERPLFIDPGKEDPEQYISFREEVPYPVDDSQRGRETIEQLGLKRKELREVRYDRYQELKSIYELLDLAALADDSAEAAAVIDDARLILTKAAQSFSEYASMARAAIASGFHVPSDQQPAETKGR